MLVFDTIIIIAVHNYSNYYSDNNCGHMSTVCTYVTCTYIPMVFTWIQSYDRELRVA
jgi:hypothetical protein